MGALFQAEHVQRPCGKRLINDGEKGQEKEKTRSRCIVKRGTKVQNKA